MLQKIQRLNVKTQTMERKSNVADQEVNELTSKNEDLTQQLQSLQDQLEESEKRREKGREESGREKDQWLQMLEQGRRLQARYEEDKTVLAQHITALEEEKERLRKDCDLRLPTPRGESSSAEDKTRQYLPGIESPSPRAGSVGDSSSDVAALKAKIEVLRLSLEEARRHNQAVDERANEILQRSTQLGGVINRALNDETSAEKAKALDPGGIDMGAKRPSSREQSNSPPATLQMDQPCSTGAPKKSLIPTESASTLAPALSRGPAEHGKQLTPSEFALGSLLKGGSNETKTLNVPGTDPRMAAADGGTGGESDPFRSRQIRQCIGEASSWSTLGFNQPRETNGISRVGSFRPLTYHTLSTHTNPSQTPARAPTPPHSPDPGLDDSSGSTRLENGKSPEDTLVGTEAQFGADLTPVSTLPTPNSASSVQQGALGESNESYFYRTQHSSEKGGMSTNMPPPPRPHVQSVEYDLSPSSSNP